MSSVQESDYCFVIEDAKGKNFRLDVRPYDDDGKKHFQSVWKRLFAALQDHHKFCGRPAAAWTAWKPWDWCEEKKLGYEGRLKYVGWCGNLPVGFLNVWADFPSVHQAGKKVLYVEHIAASPGNQNTELWNRRFQAVVLPCLPMRFCSATCGALKVGSVCTSRIAKPRGFTGDCTKNAKTHSFIQIRRGSQGQRRVENTKGLKSTWKPRSRERDVGLRSIGVSEPEIVDFKPRWMRERTAADRILDETPATGSLAEVSLRINTRLLLRRLPRPVSQDAQRNHWPHAGNRSIRRQ